VGLSLSKMGSALLNTTLGQELADGGEDLAMTLNAASAPGRADALRMQVAERLAAHRRRRGAETEVPRAIEPVRAGNLRSARIAAAVAERYAQTPSYREVLAAEAERAIQQARAAAEVAAMNAQAVAAAQQRLLEAFDESERRAARAKETAARTVEAGSAEVVQKDGHARMDASGLGSQAVEPVELNLWPDMEPEAIGTERHAVHPERRTLRPNPRAEARHTKTGPQTGTQISGEPAPVAVGIGGGFTVRLYEDAASGTHVELGLSRLTPGIGRANQREERSEAEAMALDEEIAFRQAPVFEEPAGPPVPLPANLIEFPRHLVAPRKARPRYAEGPLREESDAAAMDGQLRIFEVDAAQISTEPAGSGEADAAPTPQWTSIWLDAPSGAAKKIADADFDSDFDSNSEAGQMLEPDEFALPISQRFREIPAVQPASLGRRALAGAINGCLVLAGVASFAAAFVGIADRAIAWDANVSKLEAARLLVASILTQMGLQPAQMGTIAAVAAGFLLLAYYALFFWFSAATPGMRCARIGLCTFEDENPTRRAVRRRMGAMLLSACMLGFGFAWAALDEDKLTWHDRITRMYLRSY
jgi:hypothetical protein